MFKAVEFPAGITHLDTGLTDVDWDALSHFWLILIASKTKVQGFAKDVYKDVWGFFFFFLLLWMRKWDLEDLNGAL